MTIIDVIDECSVLSCGIMASVGMDCPSFPLDSSEFPEGGGGGGAFICVVVVEGSVVVVITVANNNNVLHSTYP